VALTVRNLVKRYGGVAVLDGVDLSVANGEIHAVLGANGAGKSTLIKCVSGAVTPDEGEIEVEGQTFRALSPREAIDAGVAVIYQELSVINTLNVCDNIFLGNELRRGPWLRRRAEQRETVEWVKRLGVDLDPRASLSNVGNAELQVVEIVKALRRRPAVLILDEPTAALSEDEATRLGVYMRRLREQGLPLLFVTHRIAEVFELADRVTVLRGGRVVLSASVSELSRAQVVAAVAGDRGEASTSTTSTRSSGAALLRVRHLVGGGIGPLDLDLAEGEILGVFGLVGSGRTELLETLFGARGMRTGTISIADEPVNLRRPGAAVAAGMALVPSDRFRNSVLVTMRAGDNILLPSFKRLARLGTLRRRARERRLFTQIASRLDLQPPESQLEAGRFSGGNQQKLVLGRWLLSGDECRILLLDEPTQGVDVGARAELYAAIREFVGSRRGAIVTSSEPDELTQIADRVLVLSRGRRVDVLEGSDITELRMVESAHLGETERGAPEEEMEAAGL
jgi:ribose transport system ATP-binding protein